jgi:hypothetical protein
MGNRGAVQLEIPLDSADEKGIEIIEQTHTVESDLRSPWLGLMAPK